MRGRKDHLLPHYWVNVTLISSAPPPVGQEGFLSLQGQARTIMALWKNCFRSRYNEGVYFEMLPFYKLLFSIVCRERVSWSLNYWDHWAGCGSYVTIVLMLWGMLHASTTCLFLLSKLGFVVKKTCFLE